MKTPNLVTVLSGVALATSGIVFGLCLPSSAAGVLWDWSYSGGGSLGGSGTFTTNEGPSPYLITGITGTVENRAITELYPPNSLGVFNDNLLYSTFPQLTENGVLFSFIPSVELGGIGIFGFEATFTRYYLATDGPVFFPLNFTATLRQQPPSTTPEPSSLLSFITLGGLMLGGAVRGARK